MSINARLSSKNVLKQLSEKAKTAFAAVAPFSPVGEIKSEQDVIRRLPVSFLMSLLSSQPMGDATVINNIIYNAIFNAKAFFQFLGITQQATTQTMSNDDPVNMPPSVDVPSVIASSVLNAYVSFDFFRNLYKKPAAAVTSAAVTSRDEETHRLEAKQEDEYAQVRTIIT